MTTRTSRLAVGNSTTSAVVVVYTCPAGKTAIVKDVRLYAGSSVGRAVFLARHSGTDVSIIDEPMTASSVTQKQGFIVLEPGDQLAVYSSTNTFAFWASGAELAGVAP